MFHKLCALVLVAPLASALILQIPENPTSEGQITVRWINEPNDPETWDLGLVNGDFGKAWIIANNVDPSAKPLTLTLPVVPVGSGYALLAFVSNDLNKNFATSRLFSIGPATSNTGSGSSTASSASSTTSSSTTSSPMTFPSTTSSPMTFSSTTSVSTTSSSTTPSASFNGNGITATPSSSSISSGGLTSGEKAALGSSIPLGVLALIPAIISVWYARRQALAGKPILSALKDDMARIRDEMARFRHPT